MNNSQQPKPTRPEVKAAADKEMAVIRETLPSIIIDPEVYRAFCDLLQTCFERCFIAGELSELEVQKKRLEAALDSFPKQTKEDAAAKAMAMRFNDA